MNWGDYLTYLGIKVPDAMAGALGGVAKALVMKERPVEAIPSMMVGMLVANFFGEGIANQIQGWGLTRGGSCFAVGIAAMLLVQFVLSQAKARLAKSETKD